jgi:hypothetical protein
MNTLTWPVAAIVIVIVIGVTVLGVAHVITPDWIERTFTALLGVLFGGGIGYALGIFRGRGAVPSDDGLNARRVSHHDLGGSPP